MSKQISRGHLRLILRYLPEREALAYAAKRPKGLDLALSVSASDPRATTRLLDASIRGRALILDEMAARRRRGADASRPEVEPFWRTLTSARQRLANLVVRGPTDQQQEKYLELVEDARREKEIAERAMAEKSASFTAELARTETGLQRASASGPTGRRAHWFHSSATIERLSMRASSMSPATAARPTVTVPSYPGVRASLGRITASRNSVGKRTGRRRARCPLADRDRHRDGPKKDPLRATGATLRQRIWDPIAKQLQDVSRVFVGPGWRVGYFVPLTALPVGQTEYFLEEGPAIHYISAERDLVPLCVMPSPPAVACWRSADRRSKKGHCSRNWRLSTPSRAGLSPPMAIPTLFRGVRSGCGTLSVDAI